MKINTTDKNRENWKRASIETHAKGFPPLVSGVALSFKSIPIVIQGRPVSEDFSFPISSILPLIPEGISSSIVVWITTSKQFY